MLYLPYRVRQRLRFFGPDRQPDIATDGATTKFLPFGQLDHGPLHHRIVVDAGPAGARATGTT